MKGYMAEDYSLFSLKPNKVFCDFVFDKEDYLKKDKNKLKQYCKSKYYKEKIK